MRICMGKIMAALALCVGSSFSAENDSMPSLDLLLASIDSTADSAAIANVHAATDSVPIVKDSIPSAAVPASAVVVADSSAPLKTVLYLDGGDRSPWFQLGVLYAVEEYGIPIDSIVATSWGAWVGSLLCDKRVSSRHNADTHYKTGSNVISIC